MCIRDRCEQWFNISRDPKDRYIAGMSMGGYGAFYAALNNPSMYNTAFSYSGLLNILERYDNPQGIDTVSYTHLDVYKRQFFICCKEHRCLSIA